MVILCYNDNQIIMEMTVYMVISARPELVLASGSPRRREILTRLGYDFRIHTSDAPEDDVSGSVTDMVYMLAKRKAGAVAELEQNCIVIGADTLVALDGKPLGKPSDKADAVRMLTALSGRTHEVATGICLINTVTGKELASYEVTTVSFRDLTPEEITDYVATGEPMDKAGAYAIQGGAGKFIKSINGSYDNIVGFPSELFTELLKQIY